MEFLSKNWFSIISLFVAIIGGIPGIISAINHLKNRPMFRFQLANYISGQQISSDATSSMILLTGTVSNEGDSVLTPAYFELECKIDGNWIKLEKTLIPKEATFESNTQDIQLSSPWENDLQRFSGSISKGMPLNGHSMFISSKIPIEKLRDNSNIHLKLICNDVFGKSYTTKIDTNSNYIKNSTTYPKHGVTIIPKK